MEDDRVYGTDEATATWLDIYEAVVADRESGRKKKWDWLYREALRQESNAEKKRKEVEEAVVDARKETAVRNMDRLKKMKIYL